MLSVKAAAAGDIFCLLPGASLANVSPAFMRQMDTGILLSYQGHTSTGHSLPRLSHRWWGPGPKTRPKKKNGILRISASRGFRKIIICHVFGEKN